VTVRVLNGSGVTGAAATAAGALKTAGFDAGSAGNAGRTATTTIDYAPNDQARAATLAAEVPGAARVVDPTLTTGTVQLVIGTNFNGIGKAVDPAPTTSAHPAQPRTAADTSCIN
jgi:hypothetical protein